MTLEERVEIGLSCRDCDYIPKHPNAGQTFAPEGETPYQVMHDGTRIIKDCYHEFITHIIRGLRGHHEPQEEKLFYEVLQKVEPGSTMLELGCSWAYYSLWFQHAIEDATNYCMEPSLENIAVGKANFALNKAKANFFAGSIGEKYIEHPEFIDWKGDPHPAPQWSVDSFLEAQKIPHLAILHCDTQKAEVGMLKGAKKSLSDKLIDHVFVSTHGADIHEFCIQELKERGYTILCSHTGKESFSVDGLVVASCKLTESDIDAHVTIRT